MVTDRSARGGGGDAGRRVMGGSPEEEMGGKGTAGMVRCSGDALGVSRLCSKLA